MVAQGPICGADGGMSLNACIHTRMPREEVFVDQLGVKFSSTLVGRTIGTKYRIIPIVSMDAEVHKKRK